MSSSLTIGEVAERTGFSTSSLRYYEGIGLVVPAARTEAGYRLYDESAVDRLAFIARGKQLGCTLEEIADLMSIGDGAECGPVQRRLHDLITTKIGDIEDRLADLTRFAGQLRIAAAHLGTSEPVDGPCGAGCACLAEPPEPEVAIACTLTDRGVEERGQEWADLLVHVAARSTGPDGGLRLVFAEATPLDELARLVVAEQRCCAFFSFTLALDAGGVTLEVRAPEGAEPVIAALFGVAG